MRLIFSHGNASGLYGRKIIALAQIALSKGLHVQSLDYQGMESPDVRAEKLLNVLSVSEEPHLLVGSSMGAYVSLVASQSVPVAGLFLLAPAVGLPGYEVQDSFDLIHVPTTIVHGWLDEVVPVGNVVDFAKGYRADLHLLDSNHRLTSVMPDIGELFSRWLDRQLSRHCG